jgi:hypothetical protein
VLKILGSLMEEQEFYFIAEWKSAVLMACLSDGDGKSLHFLMVIHF